MRYHHVMNSFGDIFKESQDFQCFLFPNPKCSLNRRMLTPTLNIVLQYHFQKEIMLSMRKTVNKNLQKIHQIKAQATVDNSINDKRFGLLYLKWSRSLSKQNTQ